MSMSPSTIGKPGAEINVTPLIDVLLVLLIIFMVIIPHHRLGESADIPLPSTEHTPPGPEPIVIQLLDAGEGKIPKLEINSDGVDWNNLEEKLTEIYQQRSDKAAFLKGDPEIAFQHVAEALDMAHQAGVDRMGLMDVDAASTKPKNVGGPRR